MLKQLNIPKRTVAHRKSTLEQRKSLRKKKQQRETAMY